MTSPLFVRGIQFPVRAVWKTKAGHPTISYWWPRQLNESKMGDKEAERHKILYMITGNPGVPEYYLDFLTYIYNNFNQQLEITIIGHLGQTIETAEGTERDKIFTLNDQVEHKIEFLDHLIEKYPSDTEFYVVNHSLGAWLSEQLVNLRPEANIKQVFSLFPALCKLRDTPNGKWMSKYVFPIQYRTIIAKVIAGINFMPPQLATYILTWFSHLPGESARITFDKLIKPSVALNGFAMADDEMKVIYDLQIDFYKKHIDKFTFYYGSVDDWVPLECYRNMVDNVPGVKAFLCEEKIPHAFVLSHSEDLALKVTCWLREYLQ